MVRKSRLQMTGHYIGSLLRVFGESGGIFKQSTSKDPGDFRYGLWIVVLRQIDTKLTPLFSFSLVNETAKTDTGLLVNQLVFEAIKAIGFMPLLLIMFSELKGLVHIGRPKLLL